MTAHTIDEYLASVPEDKRPALETLRRQIRAAAPEATEGIAYGMPAFRLNGRYFVGFSATKDRCSFYPGRGPVLAYADALAPYRVWQGTINYRADRPLPDELVRRLVQSRLAEFREARV